MRAEDGQRFDVLACAFHHRKSTICCMSPNTRRVRKKGFLAKLWDMMDGGIVKKDFSVKERRAVERNQVPNGVTLSYDVWRTVEETTPA